MNVVSALHNFPGITDWKIHPLVQDMVGTLRHFQSWKVSHIRREANDAVHQLVRWAVTELILGRNPYNIKHFLNLS